jgi:MFS family permease
MGKTFGIGLETLSLVFAFNSLGQIIIVFFVGFFADKLGRKIFHIIFVFFLFLLSIAFVFANDYTFFLILFLLLGIFSVSINMMADSSVSDIFRTNRGYYLNIAHIFYGLGAISAPVVFNAISKVTDDFRSIYIALAVLSIIVMALIIPAKYPPEHDLSIKAGVIISMLKRPRLLLINIFGVVAFGLLASIPGWLPTLFQRSLGASTSISNYSASFFWIAAVIGRGAAALLSRKYKEMSLIKIMNILIFLLLVISFFLNDPLLLLIDYLLIGFFMGSSPPLVIAYSATIYKKHSNTRVAVTFAAAAIGMLLIPPLVGVMGEYFVINRVHAFTAVFFFAYIFIFWKVFRDNQK